MRSLRIRALACTALSVGACKPAPAQPPTHAVDSSVVAINPQTDGPGPAVLPPEVTSVAPLASSAVSKRAANTGPRSGSPPALRVAITFDDLPDHGPRRAGESLVDIHARILAALKTHGVKDVYGLINGVKVETEPEGRQVLELWRDSGHPLGNHTWAHSGIEEVGAEAFIAEIDKNDALLAELVGTSAEAQRQRRVFRYPYLRQGRSAEMLDAVRLHLSQMGYRRAEVTIDFGDWAYNPAYVRCAERQANDAIAALRWDFVRRGVYALKWAEAAGQDIYGESIPHILLLHSGSFDAAVLDDLLTAYEKAGVQWIGFDEAMKHPAYQEDVRVVQTWGATLLEQRIERDGSPHPPYQLQSYRLLSHICR